MKDKSIEKLIKANYQLARKLNLMGTPVFIIADAKQKQSFFLPGEPTLELLQKTIAKARK